MQQVPCAVNQITETTQSNRLLLLQLLKIPTLFCMFDHSLDPEIFYMQPLANLNTNYTKT